MLAVLVSAGCQPTPEERLAQAEEYIAAADYRTAAIELQNLLQAAPDNARGRLLLAQTAYQLGDFSGAASQFERAIGLGETEKSTWIAYGRALLSQGRPEDAFERVVPNMSSFAPDADALVFLGDVQFALQNTTNAGAHYEEALALEPEHAEALIGLAMVSANKGDREGAERLLDFAVEKNPDVSAVWLVRGRLLQADRDYIEAAQAFRKALQLQSEATPLAERFSSKVGLVSSLIDSREFDAAGAQLDELRTRFPDHPVSGFLRGRLAFAKGDYDLAQMALQDYLSKNAGDARGRALLD